ncbi:glutamate ABC transporter substrate-binding protein [Yinghuangia sp. YIM S09857]|uniref:glutamate ABC transporter substrate-binding protein n=1 Tax=Yinghuangia sp. YIM S09857 TaxID=3436929 RepID=UPI003F533499
MLVPLAVLVAACAPGDREVAPVVLSSPSLVPVAWPATSADYPAASEDKSCDPRESLAPLARLPEPGKAPPGSTVAAIHAKGKLRVGVDQNTMFFASLDRVSKQNVGFDIDMAEAIGLAIFGKPGHVEYLVITQAQRIPVLRDGLVDLVVDTMTITCDRKKQVSFSGNYYDDGQRIMVPRDSSAHEITHLAGKRVCTARMTTSIVTLRDKGAQPYAVDNWTDCLVALQRGEVDAISTTGALLAGLKAQDVDTEVRGPRFTDEPHGMAVPLGQEDFVRFLNRVLADMIEDGRWQALYDRWLATALFDSANPEPGPPETRYRD